MATAQQRSLRVRTRAGGEPAAADQHPEIDNNNGAATESDDERSKGKKTGAVASSTTTTTTATPSTWRPGRTLVWLAYLVSWAVYAYVRATRSLDLGAYSWWVGTGRRERKERAKEREEKNLPSPALSTLTLPLSSSPLPHLPLSLSLFSLSTTHCTSTLSLSLRYARLAFAIEMLGALSVAIFGFFASRRPLPPASLRSLAAAGVAELPPFVLHVLVPCYTEPLEIVAETVWAAHAAPLPSLGGGGGGAKSKTNKIKRTVWLLDDGNDPAKAAWVAGLAKSEGASSSASASSVRYVSNRPKAPHELNGKASNLNHALGMIYPAGSEIGPDDLVAVFDSDQVAAADFWERMLPPFVSSPPSSSSSSSSASSPSSAADDIALVLSPQRFGNVDPACDVFNHGERDERESFFWGVCFCFCRSFSSCSSFALSFRSSLTTSNH